MGGGSKTILKFSIRKIRSHTPLFFFLQWLINVFGVDNSQITNHKIRSHTPSSLFFVRFICFSAHLFVTLTYASLRSKFLDKPSETSFVVLSLNNSKSKTSFYLELYSLIRNSELRSKLLSLGKSK